MTSKQEVFTDQGDRLVSCSSRSLEDGDGGNLLDQRRGSRSRPKKSGERRKSHSLEEAQLETQGLGCSLNRSNSLRSEVTYESKYND